MVAFCRNESKNNPESRHSNVNDGAVIIILQSKNKKSIINVCPLTNAMLRDQNLNRAAGLVGRLVVQSNVQYNYVYQLRTFFRIAFEKIFESFFTSTLIQNRIW